MVSIKYLNQHTLQGRDCFLWFEASTIQPVCFPLLRQQPPPPYVQVDGPVVFFFNVQTHLFLSERMNALWEKMREKKTKTGKYQNGRRKETTKAEAVEEFPLSLSVGSSLLSVRERKKV
eukprot:m.70972 g.70972  ORF g.70972 m.70972 type:complete len:119 (+) comp8329_c1_seq1:1335-1691(+)